MTPAGHSDADRLRDEMIRFMREFTEEIDEEIDDRDRAATCAFRFAGRAEALLELFDQAAAKERSERAARSLAGEEL